MKNSRNQTEVVHKEQITHLFRVLLAIAGSEVQYSNDFEEDYRKRLKF